MYKNRQFTLSIIWELATLIFFQIGNMYKLNLMKMLQVTKLKMWPLFDIAHCVMCCLAVREDLGAGK